MIPEDLEYYGSEFTYTIALFRTWAMVLIFALWLGIDGPRRFYAWFKRKKGAKNEKTY